MSSKRKCLTLEEIVKCLKLFESGKSSRAVADELKVGRTQVQNVLKRKREIMEEYESNGNLNLKRRKVNTVYEEVNNLVHKWFLEASARLVNVSGPLIEEKALSFASDLGLSDFKASNGWLDSFLKRNNVVFKTQSGERGEVNGETVNQWKDRIPNVCEGYAPEDIFNIDETGLFYRDSTKSTYFTKGETCAGGKRSKQRITVALCAYMTGEKLQPVVIGKARKPRCFGSISTDKLPVKYYANNKSWMLTLIMEDRLKWLDRTMRSQGRKILLFLDNAPVHPNIKLNNVKLQFFPANTTSRLQPMDAGIIQTLKLKYRNRQLKHVLVEMDKTVKTGPQILRDITILEAIYWINSAWNDVKADTIQKCYAKCGFSSDILSGVNSVSEASDEADTSCCDDDDDDDDDIPLAVLRMSRDLFGCNIKDLMEIDRGFSTCDNNMTDWDRPAQEIIQESQEEMLSDEDDDTDVNVCSLSQ